jgi:hypothetical protein
VAVGGSAGRGHESAEGATVGGCAERRRWPEVCEGEGA